MFQFIQSTKVLWPGAGLLIPANWNLVNIEKFACDCWLFRKKKRKPWILFRCLIWFIEIPVAMHLVSGVRSERFSCVWTYVCCTIILSMTLKWLYISHDRLQTPKCMALIFRSGSPVACIWKHFSRGGPFATVSVQFCWLRRQIHPPLEKDASTNHF
jgi:hypothetical protein